MSIFYIFYIRSFIPSSRPTYIIYNVQGGVHEIQ
jgi:hypothetical protein